MKKKLYDRTDTIGVMAATNHKPPNEKNADTNLGQEKKPYAYYTYFMTQRPFSPGTAPKKNLIDAVTFDEKEYIEEIGRKAWSELHYTEPLSEKEISDYELVPYPML